MLKLYLTYLVVGLLLSYVNLIVLAPNASEGISGGWLDVSLILEILLFTAVSVISLYKPKIAAVVGTVCMLGAIPVLPVIFDIGLFNVISAATLVFLLIAFAISVMVIAKSQPIVPREMKKPVLPLLSIFPSALFICLLVFILFRF